MDNLIYDAARFILPLLLGLFVTESFVMMPGYFKKTKSGADTMQFVFLFATHLIGYLLLTLHTLDYSYLVFFTIQEIVFIVYINLFKMLYPGANQAILNNMCMFIAIGMIILARLSFDKSVRQFIFVAVSLLISIFIPLIIKKVTFLSELTWGYAALGIFALLIVYILGSVTNGSKLSYTLFGAITFQPSEFVKILFVLFLAGILSKKTTILTAVLATVVCVVHVGILVVSKDLGTAAIFFAVYLIVLFAASGKFLYLFMGCAVGSGGCLLAYKFFYHVKVRISAWLDPFSDITGKGYQLAQSLFAIGTGGWFGLGLCQGSPSTIPYVEQDFIFSAITEELGVVFALFLIMLCLSMFLMGMITAYHTKDRFYRLVALGISVTYIFQIFLTIGGGTKFIPLTGVTLPFVSYGGSSIASSVIMFAILEGIWLLSRDKDGELIMLSDESVSEESETSLDYEEETYDEALYKFERLDENELLISPDDYKSNVTLRKKSNGN